MLINRIRELAADDNINSDELVETLEEEFASAQRNDNFEASGFKSAYQDRPRAPSANQVRHTVGILAGAYTVGYAAYFTPGLRNEAQAAALFIANEREWSVRTIKVPKSKKDGTTGTRQIRFRDFGNRADVRLNNAVVPIGFALGLGNISKDELADKLEERICE